MATSTHTWIVDALEEGTARVEIDGAGVAHIPHWLLPEGAGAGQVLSIRHERTTERSSVVIQIDAGRTQDSVKRSEAQQRQPVPTGKKGKIII